MKCPVLNLISGFLIPTSDFFGQRPTGPWLGLLTSDYKSAGAFSFQTPPANTGKVVRVLRAFLFGRMGGGFFIEGDPEKEKNNQNQRSKDLNIRVNGPDSGRIHSSKISSNLTVSNKSMIPKNKLNVKIRKSLCVLTGNRFGRITTAPRKPADRFKDNPDKVLSQGLV